VLISGVDAWTDFIARGQPHVLIASPELDVVSERGAILLDKARRAGHRLVFSGSPGGVKDSFTVHLLLNPSTYEIERTLREAGFPDERARVLARRSNGDLSSLVRCFKGSSAIPAWATGPYAHDLAVAMLGGWHEERADDIVTVEAVSGKPYTEWVQVLRRATAEPGSPLTHRDHVWKFVARHDGWRTLAERVYDSHLDAFKAASLAVLAEDDPALELEEAFLSAIAPKEDFDSISASDIGMLLGELQGRADADVEAVCRIEWKFLVLLHRDPRYKPVFLHQRMANETAFFCHFVRLAFHSATTGVAAEDDHDADKGSKEAVARNTDRLLAGFHLCPGIGDDGRVQGAVFTTSLADARPNSRSPIRLSVIDCEALTVHRMRMLLYNG
jgi:hypothetical protein